MDNKKTATTSKPDLSNVKTIYSNGKTVLQMTKAEYIETDEGKGDIFGMWWLKHNEPENKSLEKFNASLEADILAKAKERRERKDTKLDRWGYKALGYLEQRNYFWSNYRQELVAFTDKDINKNFFINNLGLEYLKTNYMKQNAKGENTGIDISECGAEIIDGCVDSGLFDMENVHGFGIFKDPTDPNHLIINSHEIWGTNPKFTGERIVKHSVFKHIKDIGLNEEDPVATKQEAQEYLDLINTWKYKRQEMDCLLSFGWDISAAFASVFTLSAHNSLTGRQGTGKTTRQTVSSNFLGPLCYFLDGRSTEPGIRQKVGSNAAALIIDEQEASNANSNKLVSFLRTAACGGDIAMGTTNQLGMDFKLKLSGCIGGIVAPDFAAADRSRFITLELLPKGEEVHPLLLDFNRQEKIGNKIRMLIIKRYADFNIVQKIVRGLMLQDNNNSRYADAYTPIISCAYFALNQNTDEAQITNFVNKFDLSDEKHQLETSDHDVLLAKILKAQVQNKDKELTTILEIVSQQCERMRNNNFNSVHAKVLGDYGIKVISQDFKGCTLLINTKDENFPKLLKNTKFSNGNISSTLSRCSNVQVVKDNSTMIGGVRTRTGVVSVYLSKDDYNYEEIDIPNFEERIDPKDTAKVKALSK